MEEYSAQYKTTIKLFMAESQILWNRFNAFLLANILFIFTLLNSNDRILYDLVRYFPLIGVVLCVIWYRMTDRGFFWTSFWIEKAREIEEQVDADYDGELEISPIRMGYMAQKKMASSEITKNGARIVIALFALIYFLIFFVNPPMIFLQLRGARVPYSCNGQ